jgi:competence protein ComEA
MIHEISVDKKIWIFVLGLWCNGIMEEAENIFIQKLSGFWKEYTAPVIFGVFSFIFIAIALVLLVKSTQNADPIRFSNEETGGNSTIGLIKIDIEGAVGKPGVYALPLDARVEDAIASAGGLTSNADMEFVSKKLNRAARVVDGGKVYIPEMNVNTTSYNNGFATSDTSVSQNQGGIVTMSDGQSQNGAYSDLISINSASISELDTLPGVGPVTAQKIIDNRPYQILEELVSKKAVGKSVYQKIVNLISL